MCFQNSSPENPYCNNRFVHFLDSLMVFQNLRNFFPGKLCDKSEQKSCYIFANLFIIWPFNIPGYLQKLLTFSSSLLVGNTFQSGDMMFWRHCETASTCLTHSHGICNYFQETPQCVIAECYKNLKRVINIINMNSCSENQTNQYVIPSRFTSRDEASYADRRGNNVCVEKI